MMFQRLHIALVLLFWALPYPGDIAGGQQSPAPIDSREAPKLEKSGTAQPNTGNEATSYFGIHQQAETSVELLNRTPAPSVSGDTDKDPYRTKAVEATKRKKDALRLFRTKTLWCSQAPGNIIYPFHFFL